MNSWCLDAPLVFGGPIFASEQFNSMCLTFWLYINVRVFTFVFRDGMCCVKIFLWIFICSPFGGFEKVCHPTESVWSSCFVVWTRFLYPISMDDVYPFKEFNRLYWTIHIHLRNLIVIFPFGMMYIHSRNLIVIFSYFWDDVHPFKESYRPFFFLRRCTSIQGILSLFFLFGTIVCVFGKIVAYDLLNNT